jgi:hypothetical protein
LLALAMIMRPAHAQEEGVELASDYDQTEVVAASGSIAASYADEVLDPPPPAGTVEQVPTPLGSDDQSYADEPVYSSDGPYAAGVAGYAGPQYPGSQGYHTQPSKYYTAGYGFAGLDTFRNIASGSYPGNNGAVAGFNIGRPLGFLGRYGIGVQAGSSYGAYNWYGRTSPGAGLNEPTQQWFFTTGLFRRATAEVPISFGAVWDLMVTDNYGAFGNSVTLSQVRTQIAYAFNPWNELGFWAAFHDPSETKPMGALGTPADYRAINQFNFFWHHKFGQNGADGQFSVGVPEGSRLANPGNSVGFPIGGSGGSLGTMILGTNWTLPVTDWMGLYANGVFMNPSSHPGVAPSGAIAAVQETWAVSFGLTFYPGHTARSATVVGRQWMPYMPVASNSTFFVDTNKTE